MKLPSWCHRVIYIYTALSQHLSDHAGWTNSLLLSQKRLQVCCCKGRRTFGPAKHRQPLAGIYSCRASKSSGDLTAQQAILTTSAEGGGRVARLNIYIYTHYQTLSRGNGSFISGLSRSTRPGLEHMHDS